MGLKYLSVYDITVNDPGALTPEMAYQKYVDAVIAEEGISKPLVYPGSEKEEILREISEKLGFRPHPQLSHWDKPLNNGNVMKVSWWRHSPNLASVSKWEEGHRYNKSYGSIEVVLNDPNSIEALKNFIANAKKVTLNNRAEDWEALFEHLNRERRGW
jgi:hypothetical protein